MSSPCFFLQTDSSWVQEHVYCCNLWQFLLQKRTGSGFGRCRATTVQPCPTCWNTHTFHHNTAHIVFLHDKKKHGQIRVRFSFLGGNRIALALYMLWCALGSRARSFWNRSCLSFGDLFSPESCAGNPRLQSISCLDPEKVKIECLEESLKSSWRSAGLPAGNLAQLWKITVLFLGKSTIFVATPKLFRITIYWE